jgi:hypothetical protein
MFCAGFGRRVVLESLTLARHALAVAAVPAAVPLSVRLIELLSAEQPKMILIRMGGGQLHPGRHSPTLPGWLDSGSIFRNIQS